MVSIVVTCLYYLRKNGAAARRGERRGKVGDWNRGGWLDSQQLPQEEAQVGWQEGREVWCM